MTFNIKTTALDTRSQVYTISAKKELGSISETYLEEQDGTSTYDGTPSNTDIVEDVDASVKQNLSTVNSAGEQLSEGQQEYFKDSKVRDENGNLLTMYHGTTSAGFNVFKPGKSDDRRSLFFTSSPANAASYSGTFREYAPSAITTVDEYNKATVMHWKEMLQPHVDEEHRDHDAYRIIADQAEADGCHHEAGILRDIANEEETHHHLIAEMMNHE